MPARGVGLGSSRRGVRWPWARRWGAGMFRGARLRVRSSVRELRGVRAERLRPRRRRAAEAAGAHQALGTPGSVGLTEAARDSRVVWVNGAVGEPAVVGPAGSVWVTRSEEEEEEEEEASGIWSRRGCERKGRPSPMGHESILELWLKVRAMRMASGCWEGSRVELHPVPAGEGAVERGLPGRASWFQTSQDGVTGPWVRGQARAGSQASGLTTSVGLGAACELASGPCGQAQVGLVSSPVVVSGLLEEVGCVGVPGPQELGQTPEDLGGMDLPEAVGVLRAGEVEMCCGDTPGLEDRGQIPGAVTQLAGCGDTSSLWEKAVEVPDAWVVPRVVSEETVSMGPSGMWQRRQVEEDIGSESNPGLWGTEQPIGMPCATEEDTRCGCDPGFRERAKRSLWVERSSEGSPGSWGVLHPAALCDPGEWKAGLPSAQGLWGPEHTVEVPKTLGREIDCVSVSGLRGTGQLPELSRTVVLGDREKGTIYGVLPGLQEKQQAETELTKEETHSGSVLNPWGRRQIEEQEALGPATFQVPGLVNQEAVLGAASCMCGRRQTVGISQTLGMPKVAGVPKHRGTPTGVPIALSGPARVPTAVWVSSPVCQGSHSEDGVNLWGRAPAVEVPVAPEALWSMGKAADCGAFSCSLGRRKAFGVPVAPEELGSLEAETGSEGFSGLSERRQTAGIPVVAGLSPGGGEPVALRVPRPVLEETGCESISGLNMEREREWGSAGVKASTIMGMPVSARISGSTREKSVCGRVSDLSRIRQTARTPMALGQLEPAREETFSEDVWGLSGGRQTIEMPAAAQVFMTQEVSTAPGLLMVGDCISEDNMGLGRRTTEVPPVARLPGLNEGEEGTEGAPGLWRSRSNRIVPGAVQRPLPLEMLTAVSTEEHVPAALWVTTSSGEEDECASGLSVWRRQCTEGARTSGGESRRAIGLAGSGQAAEASYIWGGDARLWGCPRTMGGICESIPGVAGTRTAVSLISQEDMGLSHFSNHLPQSERRQGGGRSGVSVITCHKVRGEREEEDQESK
ncbi:collagen alpha-1(I) chain [Dipodomys merriami]|uniref:collagen alpha-1(I) chain n=1 Tax=Dipodomys merriami TaxID=94247 RepID=UPI003855D50D